jgi:phenylpyruvate tautomerase PptA (4-oxalocrotonate tautomerase family)
MLTDSMKAEIATAITDAHVEVTGAPRVFVHVFFFELPPGISYSAGEVDTTISVIQGAIRAGRPVLATWYIYSKKSEICTKTINLLSCIAATKGICIQKMEYGKAPAQGTCRQRGNLFSLSVERKQGRKYQNAPSA